MPKFLLLVLAGCFLLGSARADVSPTASNSAKTAPGLPGKAQAFPWKGGQPITLSVGSQVLSQVVPENFGNNTAWWDHKDWLLDADRLEKARQAGLRFWRWPGGSSSDNYHWDNQYGKYAKAGNGEDRAHMGDPWTVSSDDFIDFCRRTGSQAIVTVNYGLARYGSVKEAADLAARWVRYFNKEKGFKVRWWEVGNEVYGPWEQGNKIDGKPQLSGEEYGRDFKVIAAAMRRVDPDILIGAVAVDADNGDDWTGYHNWMKGLLPQVAGVADYLILHQYFMWPFEGDRFTDPSNEALFGNIAKLASAKAAADQMVAKYTSLQKPLPIALTEFNLVNASPPKTIQLINGLFTAEVLGESLKAGYVASNYWDLRNGLDAKLHGDMAMLASEDGAVPDATPRPSYYAYALYERAFGSQLLQADSPDAQVKVYASRFAGGETGLVLVNQDAKPREVHLSLPQAKRQGFIQAWVLGGKDMNAKQVSWNGTWGPEGGGGPFPINTIAPYGKRYDLKQGPVFSIPGNCAAGVVIY